MRKHLIFGITLITFMVTSLISGSLFAETPTEIKVGTINSLTGANAMTGAEHLWAYKQAVADINAAGGVYVKEYDKKLPMKLIIADDKSSSDQAAQAMERLIKLDKIHFGLSSNITPNNLAAGTVCEKYKKYYQIVVSFIDMVGAENFEWVSAFFADTRDIAPGPFIAFDTLPEDKRPKRLALLMEDSLDGQGFAGGFREKAPEFGYKIIVDDPFAPGTKDFSSQLLKFKAAKVDAVITLMAPTEAVTLVRQMNEQRVLPLIYGFKGFWPREFEEAMGEQANYVIHDGFWSSNNGAPGSAELQEKFVKEFGRDSVSVGLSYANPQILAMAIEKAGTLDSTAVRDVVFGGEFKGTVMGDVKYNEKGLASMQFLGLQWWNGDRMPVYPPLPGGPKMQIR